MTTELLAPLDLAFWHLESTAHPCTSAPSPTSAPSRAPGGEPADVLELLARRAAAVPGSGCASATS